MTGALMAGMPDDQAERHRSALRDLRKELESRVLREKSEPCDLREELECREPREGFQSCELREELECRDLEEPESREVRCRPVERLQLAMRGWYSGPILLPPEMDVYGGGHLIATVTVVDVPGGGGTWFLVKQPDGLPVEAHSIDDLVTAARAITARAST